MLLINYLVLLVGVEAWSPLQATHFWDCNGGGCDATTLNPWDPFVYSYASWYAPLNPKYYAGGAQYGETLWMTGAASDYLSGLLGRADGCCGDDKFGGCGKCLLVRNDNAVNKNWTAIVMKKNRCPLEATGCEKGKAHFDLAVPGYDNLQWSLSNVCGSSTRKQTFITKAQSTVCGSWWTKGSNTQQGCSCASLPSNTPERQRIKSGCELFTEWGWKSGNPILQYEVRQCPKRYVELISGAFGPKGLKSALTGDAVPQMELIEGLVVDEEPFFSNITASYPWEFKTH